MWYEIKSSRYWSVCFKILIVAYFITYLFIPIHSDHFSSVKPPIIATELSTNSSLVFGALASEYSLAELTLTAPLDTHQVSNNSCYFDVCVEPELAPLYVPPAFFTNTLTINHIAIAITRRLI